MSAASSDRTLVKRLLGGGAQQIGAFVAQLFTLPVIAHYLDGDRMGAWALLGAAGFLVGFVDLGLATAVQRSAVTDDDERTRRLVGLSISTQLLLLPLFVLAAFFFLTDLPGAPGAVQREATPTAVLVLAGGALLGLGQPYRMFVFARGGVRQIATARTAGAVTQVVVLVGGFATYRSSLLVPGAAYVIFNCVDFGLTVYAARAMDRRLPLRPRRPRGRDEVLGAFRDGAAAFSLNLAVTAALRIDLFVLSSVAPLALVGTYQVAGRTIDMAYILAKQTTVAIMRDLGRSEARVRAVRVGTAVFGGVVTSGMAAVALVGQPFLVLLFNEHAAGQTAAVVLSLLATAAIVMSLYEVASSMVMLGAPTAWSCAVPIITGSLLNLAISVSLAPRYGVWAVAGSTLIGNAVTFALMWRQAHRILGWSAGQVARTLAPALTAFIVAVGVGLPLRPWVDHWALSLGACVVTSGLGVVAMAAVMRWRGRTQARSAVQA